MEVRVSFVFLVGGLYPKVYVDSPSTDVVERCWEGVRHQVILDVIGEAM